MSARKKKMKERRSMCSDIYLVNTMYPPGYIQKLNLVFLESNLNLSGALPRSPYTAIVTSGISSTEK